VHEYTNCIKDLIAIVARNSTVDYSSFITFIKVHPQANAIVKVK